MKIAFISLGLLALLAILYFSTRKKKDEVVIKTLEYGPFTVRTESVSGKYFNMNYGKIFKTSSVAYSIWHKGEPVTFPGKIEENTGLPYLWKVYALAGAPSPTLVAGSQILYLIFLENDRLVVRPLYEQYSDFAKLQFLDSQAGEPGKTIEVYAANDLSGMGRLDTIEGGRYLLVGKHLVLDVTTLQTWLFHADNRGIDNFSSSSSKGALAFSPNRRNIVFHGSFQHWNSDEAPAFKHAMVVYDFEKDTAYTVPYDDTDTRMIHVDEIDLEWFHTFFEWKNEGGQDVLFLKHVDPLPNWTGRYKESDHYYVLYPVKAEMLSVFLDFVFTQMGWDRGHIVKDEFHEYTGRQLHLSDGATELGIGYREGEQRLTFSKHLYAPDNPEVFAQVKKIAEAFDAELEAGKHQELFGRVIHE